MESRTIQDLLYLLPRVQQEKLFVALAADPIDLLSVEKSLAEALAAFDSTTREQLVGELVGQFLPLDALVPEIYRQWRPIVRDAVIFIGGRLSDRRLVPKLARQLILPPGTTLEQRLLNFIEQMPALQKIGQMVARNRHLEPGFRAELTRLENAIQDISPAEIFATIEHQLGTLITHYQVEMRSVLLAEASVSAVVSFAWRNPATKQRERGVFKVLKPYVIEYFAEDLNLLRGLAGYFDQNRAAYQLPPAGLGDTLDEVRHLLEREIDLPNEQSALTAANKRYQQMAGVRVPRLILELSTPYITAMSEELGVKVTDAFRNQPQRKRTQLAERMIEALLAVPLFDAEAQSVFHADLHAGNLAVDERTGDLVILDWALVERLSRTQRRHFILLLLAFTWRDPQRAYEAIAELSLTDLANDPTKAALVRGHIAQSLAQLSPLALPDVAVVIDLLDSITKSDIRFPAELLLFRKMLFTLMDVLRAVAPDVKLDEVIARYMLVLMAKEQPQRLLFWATDTTRSFNSQLYNYDLTALTLTLPLVGQRLWLQMGEQLTNQGLEKAQTLLSQSASLLPNTLMDSMKSAVDRSIALVSKTVAANQPTAKRRADASRPIDIPIIHE
ncbi:MAG: hypothetical protein KBG20_00380 [Caldilineaceae bacterium]|nr:hypothetical protein [Caldilineaceae bacterium]MBP8109699.1 hypothetical protein [Caldilineaceae bacterium]MBP8124637.1 hypothetical protein [Caldilineaceae bacterium]MBP9070714.1 hypothetical protein [Caldilineaceae bacterium]